MRLSERALGLLLGSVLDLAFADPRRAHPVAAFGRLAAAAERRCWADSRGRGALYTAALVGGATALGCALQRVSRQPAVRVATVAVSTWAVLGGTTLAREGTAMAGLLRDDRVPEARGRLGHLCGRDADTLDRAELTRATVESVAENTADAVVAPLCWGAVAGVPGLLAYRAVNTLDAMVGHRSPRYLRFGWAAARLDDLANLVPARLTALLVAALAPLVGGSAATAWQVARSDGGDHPSPNAGRVEAAFAGALGLRLGGANVYAGQRERRGTLGNGNTPEVDDIARAVRLSLLLWAVALAVTAVACGGGRR
ncbi:MAG: cobalamin biosynthesis protein [Streptosporangiales bacterium]|nr:cobalamin biosynthesis protein [Streptosporangiales bacterium]